MSNIEFKNGYITPLNENDEVDGELTTNKTSGVISDDYKINRLLEYPTIGDQLDDLFHAGVFSEEMSAKIQAIKNKYPKS